jgi:hypothetical protein
LDGVMGWQGASAGADGRLPGLTPPGGKARQASLRRHKGCASARSLEWWSVLTGRGPSEALRACLPASGARTGWDPAWPGLAGLLGFGELRLARASPCQYGPLPRSAQKLPNDAQPAGWTVRLIAERFSCPCQTPPNRRKSPC